MSKSIELFAAIGPAGDPSMPSDATQFISATPDEISLVSIRIGNLVNGKIVMGPAGQKYHESELRQPNLSQVSACATSLARTLESVFSMDENALRLCVRHFQREAGKVQSEVHVIAPRLMDLNAAKLKAAVVGFASGIASQRDMLDASASIQISPDEQQKIDDNASMFLQCNGGKPVQQAMQILVDGEAMSSIKGHFQQRPTEEKVAPKVFEIKAHYDGRRLRSRLLYVIVAGVRARQLEIFYDEAMFDAPLRALGDDKMAMLSLVVVETNLGKDKVRYELRSLEKIPTPERLDLTAPPSPAD